MLTYEIHLGGLDDFQRRVFRRWIYLSQLQQAITYETAIGLWRRLKGTAAHTMGVLYWQLNDVWLVSVLQYATCSDHPPLLLRSR